MKIIKVKNYDEMSKIAANIIASKIILDDHCTLGLATGSTPIGTYQNLIKKYQNGDISFKNIKTINLDEYVGLNEEDTRSYRYFMNDNLFNHVDIDKSNTHVPKGMAQDMEQESERYNRLIEDLSPVSVQLLGIGENGHIGFNEPNDYFPLKTHVEKLTDSTIKANQRFFEKGEHTPEFAITMGIENIMSAQTVIILASGIKKAQAMRDSLQGKVMPNVPASILQLHKDLIVIGDEDAFSMMDI